ncbi:hypothetical protein ABIA48_001063 [Pseudomonas sp. S30_BP2TU TE3576]
MIGADGARTDKAHLAAFEQRTIDVGHRTHQQHIGLLDRGSIDGTTRYPVDFTETFEEGIEQGDIFVGNNQHGRLLWRIGSLGVDAGSGPAGIVHLCLNVGAGLLAKAVCQATSMVTDTPPSRASRIVAPPLPQVFNYKSVTRGFS